MNETLYTDPLYEKVPSLLGNKISEVSTSGDFIFVVPENSKADVVIDPMDICDEHGVSEEFRFDNSK